MSEIRRSAIVRGRVQGVSFRWYTRQEAERLGVSGWVRNEADGTVRLEVQGAADAVEALLEWVHAGPPSAHVAGVDIQELPVTDAGPGFHIVR